jgi:uncharacterized membrane protein
MLPRGAKNEESRYLLAGLLLLYVMGRFCQPFAGRIPNLLIVSLHVIPPALFAVIHGSRIYRFRGILVFVFLCVGVGASFEILSLQTGFPFGHYVFTGLMGPKLFGLPIFLALAYVGMGYLSWVVALAILKCPDHAVSGKMAVALPLVASFVMVAWDLSMDPVWANIDHAWVWRNGGAYYGVPVSNFLGWYLTVFVFYLLFMLYLRSHAATGSQVDHRRIAIVFYAMSAAGNLLVVAPASMPRFIVDAAGRSWMVSGIVWASGLVSLFVMMPLVALAWARTSAPRAHTASLTPESAAEIGS